MRSRSRRETQTTTRRDPRSSPNAPGPIRSRAREGRSRTRRISSRRISASLSPPHPPCRPCRPCRFFSSPRDPRRSRSGGSRSFRAAARSSRYAPRGELGERQKAPGFFVLVSRENPQTRLTRSRRVSDRDSTRDARTSARSAELAARSWERRAGVGSVSDGVAMRGAAWDRAADARAPAAMREPRFGGRRRVARLARPRPMEKR